MLDLRITDALVFADSGESRVCDIGVRNGVIEQVGTVTGDAAVIIEAAGDVVSPGFIDIHMHEEVLGETVDGDDYDIANYMLRMGVTTGVGGNCGALRQAVDTFLGFVDKKGAPINYALYAGHTFYRNVIGNTDRNRQITGVQMENLKTLCRQALKDGAIGLSFGLEYLPGATLEEVVELVNAVREDDLLLSAHYRRDAHHAFDSIREMLEISRQTKLPLQISHIGSCSAMGQMNESLEMIGRAVSEGVDVGVDCYPYAAFSAVIGSAVFDDPCFETWNKSYDSLLLTEKPYQNVRCTEELFHKVRREYPGMYAVAFVMEEEEVTQALQSSFVMVASDGQFRRSQGHPRAAGSFARVLGRYVRDKQALSLPEAIRKMTSMPADRLGLRTKGRIAEGMDADLVIFQPDTIIDNATFERPTELASGIRYVIVDGQIAVQDNRIVNGRLGRAIRRHELRR